MKDLRHIADFGEFYFTAILHHHHRHQRILIGDANAAEASAYTICDAWPQHHQRIVYVVHDRSSISVYYIWCMTAAPSAYTICGAWPQHQLCTLNVVYGRSTISVYCMWCMVAALSAYRSLYEIWLLHDSLTVLSLWENICAIAEIRHRCLFVGVLSPGNI